MCIIKKYKFNLVFYHYRLDIHAFILCKIYFLHDKCNLVSADENEV